MSLRSIRQGSSAPTSDPFSDAPSLFTSPPTQQERQQAAAGPKPGSAEINVFDPVKSIGEGLAGLGKIPEAVGNIGFDKGPKVSDAWNIVTAPARFIGDLGVNGGPHVRDVPGAALSVVGTVTSALSGPQQWIEEQTAKNRLRDALAGKTLDDPVPEKYLARARAGENIDQLATEMTDNFEGYSSNMTKETGAALVYDPLNFVGLFTKPFKAASVAVKAAEAGGKAATLPEKVLGYTWLAATKGANKAVNGAVRAAMGPVTSGVLQAYGAGRWASLSRGFAGEDRVYAEALDKAMGTFNANMVRAVIGKGIGKEYEAAAREAISAADVEKSLVARGEAIKKVGFMNDAVQKDAEFLTRRVAPDFLGMTDAERSAETIRKLSTVTGAPEDVVRRIVGDTPDLQTAQLAHALYYGKAVDELGTLKATLRATPGANRMVQVDRVTLLAPDTLTKQRAAQALADIAADPNALQGIVERYSVLSDKYLGVPYDHSKVIAHIKALADGDLLPEELGNRIPKALQDFRGKYGADGYALGYAPKSGWKAVFDGEGNIIPTDAFVHAQSVSDPVSVANPLGRFSDSLFRAVNQRTIVLASEKRMARLAQDLGTGVSPGQAQGIHRSILRAATEAGVTPRALIDVAAHDPAKYANRIEEIFGQFLSDTQMKILREKTSPEWLFFKAIEGNFSQVGLTQKLTGVVKTKTVNRNKAITIISEHLYPGLRFKYNPYFQAQELVESPFWNFIRGVHGDAPADVKAVAERLFNEDPNFRFLTEEYHGLFLQGQQAAQQATSLMGGVLRKVGNVSGFKKERAIKQTIAEHYEIFRDAVREINPKVWQAWEEAAGTTDPRKVVAHFLAEREALVTGRVQEVERMLGMARAGITEMTPEQLAAWERYNAARDAAFAQNPIGRNATEAEIAARRAAVEKEIAPFRDALPKTGISPNDVFGPTKAADANGLLRLNADEETMWQAYVFSMRRAAEQARVTHYFREGRGWLERSLNHPFLGLYPLSYMTKVYGEFARFLLRRPFGLDAPLAGYAAMRKVYEWGLMDENIQGYVQDHPDTVFFIGQLLPGTPNSLPVKAPTYVRRIVSDAQSADLNRANPKYRGKNFGVSAKDVTDAIVENAQNTMNPLRIVEEGGKVLTELTTSVEKSAKKLPAPKPPDLSQLR